MNICNIWHNLFGIIETLVSWRYSGSLSPRNSVAPQPVRVAVHPSYERPKIDIAMDIYSK